MKSIKRILKSFWNLLVRWPYNEEENKHVDLSLILLLAIISSFIIHSCLTIWHSNSIEGPLIEIIVLVALTIYVLFKVSKLDVNVIIRNDIKKLKKRKER